MNNKYEVKIESPLLRAGLTIKTTCSEKYLPKVVEKLMSMVREINNQEAPKQQ